MVYRTARMMRLPPSVVTHVTDTEIVKPDGAEKRARNRDIVIVMKTCI